MTEAGNQCRVLSGWFAMLIQLLLAAASGASLVVKRCREHPPRPLLIWFMDSTKQAASLGMQHFVNIILAVFWGKQKASQCIWFATNLLVAVLCGVFILAAYMRLFGYVVKTRRWHCLKSGNYGHGARPRWDWWLAQMVHWVFISCLEKFVTALIFVVPFYSHIDGLLSRIEDSIKLDTHPEFELVLVMVIFPALLNAIYAWIVDNIIKNHDTTSLDSGSRSAGSSFYSISAGMLSAHSLSAVSAEGRNLPTRSIP